MKKIFVLFALLFTVTTAYAEPNYTYTVIQPGQMYVNTTNMPQEVYFVQNGATPNSYYNNSYSPNYNTNYNTANTQTQPTSLYQSANNGISMVTNLMYSIRTLASQFGVSY